MTAFTEVPRPANPPSQPNKEARAEVISVRNLSHHFPSNPEGRQVLADVDVSVFEGEMLCLLGPSGCGKSTLLSIMGGLTMPTRGTVKFGTAPVVGPRPADAAFVFQESVLFPWNTVLQNMEVALEFRRVPASERRDRAMAALAKVGMAEFAHYYPGQVSGGMKQRVALASALSLETPLLFMDEPFAALDEQTRMILGEDLSQLLASVGKTIVFVTHSLSEAVFLADRIVVMTARPGRIKAVIDVDEQHPRAPDFMLAPRFSEMRNQLFGLLHDEIRKSAP